MAQTAVNCSLSGLLGPENREVKVSSGEAIPGNRRNRRTLRKKTRKRDPSGAWLGGRKPGGADSPRVRGSLGVSSSEETLTHKPSDDIDVRDRNWCREAHANVSETARVEAL